MRWVDQAMTEDLPPLKFPAYFEDFDKAKALVAAGRYKTALLTIRKIKEPRPEQVLPIALAKAEALAVTGRTEEALRTLTAADVSVSSPARTSRTAKRPRTSRWPTTRGRSCCGPRS